LWYAIKLYCHDLIALWQFLNKLFISPFSFLWSFKVVLCQFISLRLSMSIFDVLRALFAWVFNDLMFDCRCVKTLNHQYVTFSTVFYMGFCWVWLYVRERPWTDEFSFSPPFWVMFTRCYCENWVHFLWTSWHIFLFGYILMNAKRMKSFL
jgi:hypothetical protein